MPNNRPNILCFCTDQQRYDHLSCNGNKVLKTPNIDKIAAQGTCFDRAYVANPLCMPARSTLFTGLTPRGHGVRTNGIPLDKNIPTLPEALRQAGYRTHSVGKLHLECHAEPYSDACRTAWQSGAVKKLPTPYYGFETVDFIGSHGGGLYGDYINELNENHPHASAGLYKENALSQKTDKQCFSQSIPQELHHTHWIADKTMEFLDAEKDSEKPFFLWCSFPDPHHPYCAPQPWCDMYSPDDIEVPEVDEKSFNTLPPFYRRLYEESGIRTAGLLSPAKTTKRQLQEIIAMTYGMIAFIDSEIGRVMQKLKDDGLDDNTVVVFLTDHADMMGDHGMIRKGPFDFEGLYKIPFIWRWQGHFQAGARAKGLASQIDFVPTLMELCGISALTQEMDGEFLPDRLPWALPGKSLLPILEGKKDAVNDCVLIENDEDYLALRIRTLVTETHKITVYAGQAYGELYDLANDPHENHNLWDVAEYQALKNELSTQLLQKYLQTESVTPYKSSQA